MHKHQPYITFCSLSNHSKQQAYDKVVVVVVVVAVAAVTLLVVVLSHVTHMYSHQITVNCQPF